MWHQSLRAASSRVWSMRSSTRAEGIFTQVEGLRSRLADLELREHNLAFAVTGVEGPTADEDAAHASELLEAKLRAEIMRSMKAEEALAAVLSGVAFVW